MPVVDLLLHHGPLIPTLSSRRRRWYNATYTLFAVSILLAVVFRQLARTQQSLEAVFVHIDRAIVILRAMDDCLVAKNAVAIITRTLARAKKVHQPALFTVPAAASSQDNGPCVAAGQVEGGSSSSSSSNALLPCLSRGLQPEFGDVDSLLRSPATTGDGLGEAVDEIDWLSFDPLDDGQQALFWTKWAQEIDSLGT